MRDDKIVQLLCKREEEGLTALAEKYEKLLVYIASGILKNRVNDVEECINDTYFKVWDHIYSFDLKRASLKTYLKVIVRNTALNRLRDISRREERLPKEALGELADRYIDYRQNVEEQIISKEDLQWMNEMLLSLQKKDRELMLRRYFYMETSKEIAETMKMSVNAVDTKLSRLRAKLKQEFDRRE